MTTNGNEKRPLPDGWTWTTVGDVAEDTLLGLDRRRGQQSQEQLPGTLPYVKMDKVTMDGRVFLSDLVYVPVTPDEQKRYELQDNDILFNTRNSEKLVGKVGIVNNPPKGVVYNNNLMRIRTHREVNARFICAQMTGPSFRKEMDRVKKATTSVAAVYAKDLFPLPLASPPLPEQERIVAEIEKQFTRLDQAVVSLRRLQSNLARYKASVLKAACEGRLVSQDPADEPADQLLERILAERRTQWQAANLGKKYKDPVGVEGETAVLPDLPKGWTAVKLEQIILSIQTGPFGSSLHKSDYVEDGIPVVNPASIIDGKIKPISRMAISEDTRERLKGFILKNGDVIMGRRGEMGRSAMITEKEDGWLCGTGSLILRFAKPVSRQYLVFLFGSESVKAYLGNASVGTTMQNLNQKILLNMIIGLPPQAEQERIVAEVERRLSVVTAVEQTITANLSRAERLRQSILHRAFTGQLVPQEGVA